MPHSTFVCVCVCVCVSVHACMRVCFTSTHGEGLLCLKQFKCQGTDERCCTENVTFLSQVPSLLLQNEVPCLSNQPLYLVYLLEVVKGTNYRGRILLAKHWIQYSSTFVTLSRFNGKKEIRIVHNKMTQKPNA